MSHIDPLTVLHREPTSNPAQPAPSPAEGRSVIKGILPRSFALKLEFHGYEDEDFPEEAGQLSARIAALESGEHFESRHSALLLLFYLEGTGVGISRWTWNSAPLPQCL